MYTYPIQKIVFMLQIMKALVLLQVRYKETRKADMVISSSSGSDTDDIGTFSGSSLGGLCYCIEIKDTILPPWVVCGVSAAMSSEGRSFLSTYILLNLSWSNCSAHSASRVACLHISHLRLMRFVFIAGLILILCQLA